MVQGCLAWSDDQEIGIDAVPIEIHESQQRLPSASLDTSLRAWAAHHVQTVFQECGGNKRLACRLLGIHYRTLQSYLSMAAAARSGRAA